MIKVYAYQGCSTCRSALKWLKLHSIAFEEVAIRETPPSVQELGAALRARGNELRGLFNVSGQEYRSQGLKDKLPTLSSGEALQLLAGNGNLIKRPFAVDERANVYLVGFKEGDWTAALL